MLLYTTGLGLCLGVALMNIPPALDVLMARYQVNYLGISILITALLWAHALCQVPAGMVADRWGVKPTLAWGLFFLALGNIMPLILPGMFAATTARIVCGLGTGLCFIAAMKLLAMIAPPERAGVFQAYMGGTVALGSIAAYLALPCLAAWDWRWPFALPAGLSLGLLILLRLLPIEPVSRTKESPAVLGVPAVLALPQAWILGLVHALSWGSVLTLGNWTPSLLTEAKGALSASSLAWSGALVMLVSGVGRIAGAPLLARFRPSLVAGLSMFLLAVIYLGICYARGAWSMTFLIVAGVSLASVNFGSIFQLASQATGVGNLGVLLGFVNMLANAGAIIFTLLLGWFKDQTGSFSLSFLFLAAACIFAGLLTFYFYRRRA